ESADGPDPVRVARRHRRVASIPLSRLRQDGHALSLAAARLRAVARPPALGTQAPVPWAKPNDPDGPLGIRRRDRRPALDPAGAGAALAAVPRTGRPSCDIGTP